MIKETLQAGGGYRISVQGVQDTPGFDIMIPILYACFSQPTNNFAQAAREAPSKCEEIVFVFKRHCLDPYMVEVTLPDSKMACDEIIIATGSRPSSIKSS